MQNSTNTDTGPHQLKQRSESPANGARASVRRWLPLFVISDKGTAAIEFALVVPVLAAMVLGISQVTDILVGSSHMETAVRAGIQYALNGGSDMTVAQNAGMQAWANPPANATLVASEYCTCAGGSASCTQTCSDGSVPYQYASITASAHLGGTVYNIDKTLTQTARIR